MIIVLIALSVGALIGDTWLSDVESSYVGSVTVLVMVVVVVMVVVMLVVVVMSVVVVTGRFSRSAHFVRGPFCTRFLTHGF